MTPRPKNAHLTIEILLKPFAGIADVLLTCYRERVKQFAPVRMTRLFKILVWLFAGLLLLTVCAVGLAYYLIGRSLPDYNQSLNVDGTTGRIEIVRDNHAVPHIFAEDERDVYFGLGFAHAQDRMWQMLMLRRTVQGRLAEVFGPAAIKDDSLMRSLGLYEIAGATLDYQTPEIRAILDSYSAGVNAHFKHVRDDAQGRGTPELFQFNEPFPLWTATDSLAILKLMAFRLTDKAQMETLQGQLAFVLPPERLIDLFPDQDGAATLSLPEFAALYGAPPPPASARPEATAFSTIMPRGLAGASNAFAVAEKRSASGGALLAGDPHMNLTAPSIWMLARMQLGATGVIGGTIPGIPAILSGRNANFSWGLTASYLDDQDLFLEKLDPANPERYLTPTGYRDFERRDVIINVKDAPGITLNVRKSLHGPVIDADYWNISGVEPAGHVTTLSWTGLDHRDRTIEAIIRLMKITSVKDSPEVLKLVHSPSVNVVMADRENVGIQAAGRAPERETTNTSQGRIPTPGWLRGNSWTGYLPFESNPADLSPDSGIVVNTNNRITDKAFPEHWSFDWGDSHRIQRAERMLNDREFHTLDSMIEIQTDVISEAARIFLAVVGQDLWYTGEAAPDGTIERQRNTALQLLVNWNGDMSEHDPEPLIYATWARVLQRRLVADEVGELVSLLDDFNPGFIERVYKDVDGAAIWCDIKQTQLVAETCTDMARLALDEAILILTEAYGPRIESWRWGSAHEAIHRHAALGSNPILGWLFNIKQETAGGDFTLAMGKSRPAPGIPFQNVHGSTYRGVYDMADTEASVYIISTGQSGHFLSRHYEDLARLWRRFEYIPMTLDPVLARGGNTGVTVFTPNTAR